MQRDGKRVISRVNSMCRSPVGQGIQHTGFWKQVGGEHESRPGKRGSQRRSQVPVGPGGDVPGATQFLPS